MCCSTAKWKREEVPDHKFDFIDVKDFYDGAFIRRFTYLFLFAIIIKNILVYTADLWTVYLLFTSVKWADNIKSQKVIDLQVSRWIFFASIVCSFLLLLWELRKTIRVVKSRDIAYAYTCTGAYRFYSVRSYPHYCLFSQINNSRKKTDRVAFFVYFTLKGWKRFLLAEAPRQIVNGIALFNVYVTNGKFNIKQFYENGDTIMANIMFGLMTFTFCVWAISALLLVFAAILYVPLLCQIRGNLKEYVCHKIDKRLALLLRNKSRKRILEERREQLRLAQEMQALPGANTTALLPMREPTLPQMGLLNANQKRPMQPQQQHQSQQHQQHSQNAVMSLPGDKGPHPAVYSNNPSNQPHPPSSSNYAHAHPPSSASYHHISQQQQQQQPYPMSANSPHPYSGNSNQPSYDNASAHHHGGRRRADSTVSSNSGYSQPRTGGPVMDGGNGIRPPVPPVPLQHMTTSHSYSASVTSGHGARGPASSSSSHYPYDKETTAFTMPPLPPPPPRSEADIRDDISESSYAYSNTGRPAVEEYNTRPLPRPLPLHQQQQQQQPASSSHSSRPPHSSTSNQSAKSPTQSSFAGEHRDPHRYPFKNIYDHPPRDTPDSPMSTVNPSRLPPPPISTSSTALQHPRQPSNEGHRYGGTSNNGGVTMTSSHSATSNSAAYYKPSEDRYHQSPTRTRVEDTNNNSNNNHDMNNDDHDDGEPTFNRYNDRGRYAARHYNQHHQPQQQQQQQQQHQHHQNSSSHSNQIRRPGNSQGSQHGSRNHGGGAGGPVYF